ncbi:GrlR family regulatory protein [Cereibacter sphaeroides]|uniref:GrlR family regulatory protein n=1 Tax=Cereibacter johrii TaxID=445629 RepID=UPI0010CA475C|nr:hypothetical protein EYE35_09175 [Cereibacter sphaeroides]
MIRSDVYFVAYESNQGTEGYGTLCVNGASLTGGDGGYRYRGYVKSCGGIFRGRVAVTRVDPGAESIFGPVSRFELVISGRADGKCLFFSGFVLGWPSLRVRFRLIPAARIAAE